MARCWVASSARPIGAMLFALVHLCASTQLAELSESTFDTRLREQPVALVAFVSHWCRHCAALSPILEAMAEKYAGTGIAIAQCSSSTAGELLDRFQIDSYPTLLWLDGSKKWPFYASEATPFRYSGSRTQESLVGFIESQTGITPARRVEESPAREQRRSERGETIDRGPSWPAASSAAMEDHACTELSKSYTACMRHRRDRQHLCTTERHNYLLCMTGRWAIHPDKHEELARRYTEFS